MSDSSKPTLHHLKNSQSQSILWLLEELGVDYHLVPYQRIKGRAPPALKEIHPRGKSPVLVTGAGRVITERSAIALYLIRTYDGAGRFQAAAVAAAVDDDDLVREEELVSLGTASLSPPIMFAFILGLLVRVSPWVVWPLTAGFHRLLRKVFLDAELDNGFAALERALLLPKKKTMTTATTTTGGTQKQQQQQQQQLQQHAREYLMGGPDPTRADFVVQWYVEWAVAAKAVELQKYPAVKAWYERCQARPAYRRALEKGGPYDLGQSF